MIHFHDVNKSFGSKKVLNNLNIHIQKGKITFVVGKSGEGKSVTLKHIVSLLKPDSGIIEVDGLNLSELDERNLQKFRRKIGVLFQTAALFDSLSVEENILFPLREHGYIDESFIKSRLDEVSDQLDLGNLLSKSTQELSIGEKKRVGLARSMIHQPSILLYDEPTTGMDPLISNMVDQLIVKVSMNSPQLTSVVISHDLKATLEIADDIIMLYQGKCILSGNPEKFKKSEDPIVRQFFSGKASGPMEFF